MGRQPAGDGVLGQQAHRVHDVLEVQRRRLDGDLHLIVLQSLGGSRRKTIWSSIPGSSVGPVTPPTPASSELAACSAGIPIDGNQLPHVARLAAQGDFRFVAIAAAVQQLANSASTSPAGTASLRSITVSGTLAHSFLMTRAMPCSDRLAQIEVCVPGDTRRTVGDDAKVAALPRAFVQRLPSCDGEDIRAVSKSIPIRAFVPLPLCGGGSTARPAANATIVRRSNGTSAGATVVESRDPKRMTCGRMPSASNRAARSSTMPDALLLFCLLLHQSYASHQT